MELDVISGTDVNESIASELFNIKQLISFCVSLFTSKNILIKKPTSELLFRYECDCYSFSN